MTNYEILIQYINDQLEYASYFKSKSSRVAYYMSSMGAVEFFTLTEPNGSLSERAKDDWDNTYNQKFIDLLAHATED